MVKKITKYLKFVVCCALILSLIAPSYAALSASDGSAFVTKAEFDSALADFNARLTTFEAGINSKIDSQVSSYLDRNGIWNGKVQIITEQGLQKYTCWLFGDNPPDDLTTIVTYNLDLTKEGAADTLWFRQHSNGPGVFATASDMPSTGADFISVNKSGMCVFDFQYGDAGCSAVQFPPAAVYKRYGYDMANMKVTNEFYMLKNGVKWLALHTWENYYTPWNAWNLGGVTTMNGQMYGFVSNGDVLKLAWQGNIINQGMATWKHNERLERHWVQMAKAQVY